MSAWWDNYATTEVEPKTSCIPFPVQQSVEFLSVYSVNPEQDAALDADFAQPDATFTHLKLKSKPRLPRGHSFASVAPKGPYQAIIKSLTEKPKAPETLFPFDLIPFNTMKGKVNPAFKQFRISHIEIQPSAKIADFECRGRYQRKAVETPKESRTWRFLRRERAITDEHFLKSLDGVEQPAPRSAKRTMSRLLVSISPKSETKKAFAAETQRIREEARVQVAIVMKMTEKGKRGSPDQWLASYGQHKDAFRWLP